MRTNNNNNHRCNSNSASFPSSACTTTDDNNSSTPAFSRSDDFVSVGDAAVGVTDYSSPNRDHGDGYEVEREFVQKQFAILEYIEEGNKKPRARILPSIAAIPTKALDEAVAALAEEERAPHAGYLHDEASVENRSQAAEVYVDLEAMLDSDELMLEQLKILNEIEQNHRPACSSVGTTTSAANMKAEYPHHLSLNEPPAFVYEHGKIAPSASSRARDLCDMTRLNSEEILSRAQQSKKTTTSCSVEHDIVKQRIQPNMHHHHHHHPQSKPGAVHSNSTPLLKKPKSEKEQDSLACLSNGKTILIRGMQHAYQAMENGTAETVQCFDCQAVYKISPSATSLFCVCCNQVSSLELARNTMILSSTTTISPMNQARQC